MRRAPAQAAVRPPPAQAAVRRARAGAAAHCTSGFTLLETLVALVVLGFVVAGLAQGLHFGLNATERQDRLAAQRGDLDAVDRLLRRLVAQMQPGTLREPSGLSGDAFSMEFTTDLGAAAAPLGESQAKIRLAVVDGRLLLRWRPDRHVQWLGPPPPLQSAVLLDGLARVQFSYWGTIDQTPPAWKQTWQAAALPTLVRVRFVFPEASGRRWPDIVAAPARPTPTA